MQHTLDNPLSPHEQDLEAHAALARCRTLTYLWHVENGHRAWADSEPPSCQQLKDLLDYMDNNKEWFACKYEPLLCDLLEERVVKSLDTLVKHQVEVELTRARKVLEICFYS